MIPKEVLLDGKSEDQSAEFVQKGNLMKQPETINEEQRCTVALRVAHKKIHKTLRPEKEELQQQINA